ncbi:T9SS type A sorting domain-containing protein [Flavobacterium alkalisoli]|uniref:T9SS type A sorting domain-containing protein n=1 Tax=Flavobacterium alkalisoli TaxID=2602769 RepID=UPI003A909A9A
MKKLLLLLLGSIAYAQPNMGTPNDLSACDDDLDSFTAFNLTLNNDPVLNGLDSNAYTVSYHETEMDAVYNLNAIVNPVSYANLVSSAQTIYVRLTENADSSNYDVAYFTINVANAPGFSISDGAICVEYNTNEVIDGYTLDTSLNMQDYTFAWFKDGVIIDDANMSTYTATTEGHYEVMVTDAVNGCSTTEGADVTISGPAALWGDGTLLSDSQNIVIPVNGYGEYNYGIDEGPMQAENYFTDLELGTHTGYVYDLNGCGTLTFEFEITIPNAPTGEPEQYFTEGQTLADIEVEGENILWYANDIFTTDDAMDTNDEETPLPANTVLANEAIYYATQTINDSESYYRLPVKVYTTLSNQEQAFKNLTYYPNPVSNILTLSNANEISKVEAYNLLGQKVLAKDFSTTEAQVDISSLETGIYLVKVTSQEKITTTIRIQKQ